MERRHHPAVDGSCMNSHRYKAIVSSDWSECLSPNGPFDPISVTYPELGPELSRVFRAYTGNEMSLTLAVEQIGKMLRRPLSREQMDAYLDAYFRTYTGVPNLIEWCLARQVLFMINTTGAKGYFQRVFAKGLMPPVPVVSANPMIAFPDDAEGSERYAYEVLEIDDKPKNTKAVMKAYGIRSSKLIVIGDSGGDGPHFQWAAKMGGFLVGSMTKPSLTHFCSSRGIEIDRFFGLEYRPHQKRNRKKEMTVDFTELADLISDLFNTEV